MKDFPCRFTNREKVISYIYICFGNSRARFCIGSAAQSQRRKEDHAREGRDNGSNFLRLLFPPLETLPGNKKKAAGYLTELPYFTMVGDEGLEPSASGSGV